LPLRYTTKQWIDPSAAGFLLKPPASDRIQIVEGLQQPRGWGHLEDSAASPENFGNVSASAASLLAFNIPVQRPKRRAGLKAE
jgi:hypothetical protein